MIEIHELSKSFGKTQALDRVSLQIGPGIHGLLGPNGSGKTTLFRCLTNILQWDSGELTLPDQISYLPQKFGFYKSMKVRDVMQYFASLKKLPPAQTKIETRTILEKVNLFEEVNKKVGALSGGMLRRLGIALAMQGSPELILVDEPTVGLDPEERLNFKQLMADLGKETSLIISTHIVDDVEALCDQIIIMHKGRVLAHASQKEVAEYAKGKVYLLPVSEKERLESPYTVTQKVMVDHEECIRVLSTKEQAAEHVKPTIEDGYLLYIKEADLRAQ